MSWIGHMGHFHVVKFVDLTDSVITIQLIRYAIRRQYSTLTGVNTLSTDGDRT